MNGTTISRQSTPTLSRVKQVIDKLKNTQIGTDPGRQFRRQDLILLLRNMTTLVENGVSLPSAIEAVAVDRSLRRYRGILASLSRDVKGGESLSAAMTKFPLAFNQMLINQMRVGERSGALDETLLRITEQIEHADSLKRAIVKKLTYPAILVAAGLGSVTFMMLWVIPTFQKMYEEAGATFACDYSIPN